MTDVRRLRAEAAAVPWLRHLGEPSARDAEVVRIHDWDEWPGPENPGGDLQSTSYQAWHDLALRQGDRQELWKLVHDDVFDLATNVVPYDPGEDAWHGPSAAAFSAGWIAATRACLLAAGIPLEAAGSPAPRSQWTLAYEWTWYVEGHWPCHYVWNGGYLPLEDAWACVEPQRIVVL